MNSLSRYITEEMLRAELGFVRISGASPGLGLPVRITERPEWWTQEDVDLAQYIIDTAEEDFEAQVYRDMAIEQAKREAIDNGIPITIIGPSLTYVFKGSADDYPFYGVLFAQIKGAIDEELPDRPYRIDMHNGGVDFPDRLALWNALLLYLEKAQGMFEAII